MFQRRHSDEHAVVDCARRDIHDQDGTGSRQRQGISARGGDDRADKMAGGICQIGWLWVYDGGIERGERNVALRNIERIADTLGISLSELMRGL